MYRSSNYDDDTIYEDSVYEGDDEDTDKHPQPLQGATRGGGSAEREEGKEAEGEEEYEYIEIPDGYSPDLGVIRWLLLLIGFCVPGLNLLLFLIFGIIRRNHNPNLSGFCISALIFEVAAVGVICAALLLYTGEPSVPDGTAAQTEAEKQTEQTQSAEQESVRESIQESIQASLQETQESRESSADLSAEGQEDTRETSAPEESSAETAVSNFLLTSCTLSNGYIEAEVTLPESDTMYYSGPYASSDASGIFVVSNLSYSESASSSDLLDELTAHVDEYMNIYGEQTEYYSGLSRGNAYETANGYAQRIDATYTLGEETYGFYMLLLVENRDGYCLETEISVNAASSDGSTEELLKELSASYGTELSAP